MFFGVTYTFVCSKAKETQGENFPAGLKFIYGAKTSNISLCPHLERVHLQLYMELKEKNGWKTQLPGQASQATSALDLAQDTRIDTYSEQTFHQHIVNFIVVDDQVCLDCEALD